ECFMTNSGRPFGRFCGILPHSRETTSRGIGKPASNIGRTIHLLYIAGQTKSDRILPRVLALPPRQPNPSAGVSGRGGTSVGSIVAIKASPTVKAIGPKPIGEILWLAVTLVEFAVIMGIVCWPLSAELLPRLATGAPVGNRSVSVVAATSARAA